MLLPGDPGPSASPDAQTSLSLLFLSLVCVFVDTWGCLSPGLSQKQPGSLGRDLFPEGWAVETCVDHLHGGGRGASAPSHTREQQFLTLLHPPVASENSPCLRIL